MIARFFAFEYVMRLFRSQAMLAISQDVDSPNLAS